MRSNFGATLLYLGNGELKSFLLHTSRRDGKGTGAWFAYVPARASVDGSTLFPRKNFGTISGRRTRRSAVAQDYVRHGDLSTVIENCLLFTPGCVKLPRGK